MAGSKQRTRHKEPTRNVAFDRGTSYGVAGIILAIIVLFPIPLWLKATLLLLASILCFVFFRRSHWTHAWSRLKQNLCAAGLVFVLVLIGIPQFISQRRSEHPVSTPVISEKGNEPKLPQVGGTGTAKESPLLHSGSSSTQEQKHPSRLQRGPRNTNPMIHLDQRTEGNNSPNAATFGDNSPITIQTRPDPNSESTWYEFNGVKHSVKGSTTKAVVGHELSVFAHLRELETKRDWVSLSESSEDQIVKTPDWLTPYLFSGIASANLGHKEEAIERLEYVVKNASGQDEYSDADRILKMLK